MKKTSSLQRILPFLAVLSVPLLMGARGGCGVGNDVPLGGDPGYDPCAGKTCGEPCTLCAPTDPNCAETAQVKQCNTQGKCGAGPATCSDVKCGHNTCASDEYCCNASCGICAKPGEGCITLACEDSCKAMDAKAGDPACAVPLGYAFDGNTCNQILCACDGADCDKLYPSQADCEAATKECAPREQCGPTLCEVGEECCNASCGICTAPGGACIQVGCESCDAWDAQGQGPCAAFFGYAWDGNSCSGIGGCSCQGADCSRLYPTPEACEDAQGHCGGSDRMPASGACVKNSNDACQTDADCMAGGCGGELCFNPQVSSGVSTCECTTPQGVSCGCVDNKCTWYN